MCKPQDTLNTFVSPPCPISSTVMHCDECGTMTIAWHDGQWTTDCLYDGCCLSCFSADLLGNAVDKSLPLPANADLFPNRIELDINGFITVNRPEGLRTVSGSKLTFRA